MEALIFDDLSELPYFENLELANSIDNIRLPERSPLQRYCIDGLKGFISEYQSCHRVGMFLSEKGIVWPTAGFGRQLPIVSYESRRRCSFCSGVLYRRNVSTQSDVFHKRAASLHCVGCDGYLVMGYPGKELQEYSWTMSPPKKKEFGKGKGDMVSVQDMANLPKIERLDMVERVQQIIIPDDAPFTKWDLDRLRVFLTGYHTCLNVAGFLQESGVDIHPNKLGRVLPRVKYSIANHGCRSCKQKTFTRQVSNRYDVLNENEGFLICTQCGDRNHIYLIGFPQPPVVQRIGPNQTNTKTEPRDVEVKNEFIHAVFDHYVPESKRKALYDFIEGKISIREVEQKTGIFIGK